MGRSAGKLHPLPHRNHVVIMVVVSSLISLERSLPPRSTPWASLCISQACFFSKQMDLQGVCSSVLARKCCFSWGAGRTDCFDTDLFSRLPWQKFTSLGKGCQNRGRLRPNIHTQHKSEPDTAEVKMSSGCDPSTQQLGLFYLILLIRFKRDRWRTHKNAIASLPGDIKQEHLYFMNALRLRSHFQRSLRRDWVRKLYLSFTAAPLKHLTTYIYILCGCFRCEARAPSLGAGVGRHTKRIKCCIDQGYLLKSINTQKTVNI